MAPFAPETIFHIGSFPVTNTVLDTLLVDVAIVGFVYYVAKNIRISPTNQFQNATEMIVEIFYNLTESVTQTAAKKIFPFFMSFFLYILLINWGSLLPGFGTIGIWEHTVNSYLYLEQQQVI